MKQCPLCGLEKTTFRKSHILPKTLYKGLKGQRGNEKIVQLTPNRERKTTNLSDYFYQNNLLCNDCEVHLSNYETYLISFLRTSLIDTSNFIEKNQDLKIIHVQNVDYIKLKLGLLSILWRSHITSLSFFEIVELNDEDSECLRDLILNNEPGSDEEYTVFISTLDVEEDIKNVVLPIEKIEDNRGLQYRYFIDRYIFHFFVGNDIEFKEKGLLDFVPNSSGNIRVLSLRKNYGKEMFESYLFNNPNRRPRLKN